MSFRSDASFPEPHADAQDDPGTVGRGPSGVTYRCQTCGWRGKAEATYRHHCDNPAHVIVLRDAPQMGPVQWGCCHELSMVTPNAGGKDHA